MAENIQDPRFLNALHTNLMDSEIIELSSKFKKSIDSADKNQLKRTLLDLKFVAQKYHFDKLDTKIDKWEECILNAVSFSDLHIEWENISQILIAMVVEAKRVIKEFSSMSESEGNNKLINTLNNDVIGMTPMKNKEEKKWKSNNRVQKEAKKDDDFAFLDLKPINFDCLYDNKLTAEDIAEEIEKLSKDSMPKKITSTLRGLKAANNSIIDSAYPFKRESFKFDCCIF